MASSGEPFGPFLNIDAVLGREKDRIALVGVELEGGWEKLVGELKPQPDGSVFHNGIDARTPEELTRVNRIKHKGEIPLPPVSQRELPALMKLYYPFYVDKSCGMHVHLSTNRPFTYQRLMVNTPFSYPATIVEYIWRWAKQEKLPESHAIWPRLAGLNEYCQHVFHADEQVKTTNKDYDHHRHGHRYTVISFCWSRYKTLECRLLPMMETADQGIRAVQEVVRITNAFIAATKDKEPIHRSTVEDSRDMEITEHRGYV